MTNLPIVVVKDMSTDGRGVASVDGAACFIAGAFPGDRVRIEIVPDSEPRSGILLELLEASPHRVEHRCPHAHACPASPWGRLAYEQQLEAKQRLVARTLKKALGEVEVLPTVPSPKSWNYRGRISLTVWKEDGHVRIGYQMQPREEAGIPIQTCNLAAEPLDALLHDLTAHVCAQDIPDEFLTRRIQVHSTDMGAGLMLVFPRYPNGEVIHFWENVLHPLKIPGGTWIAQGSRAGIVAHGMRVTRVKNARSMASKWMNQALEIHPASFTQANAEAAECVHQRLRRCGDSEQRGAVWDLYGGYGALGFAAAGRERLVTVMDVSSYSERTFADLARMAGNANSRFLRGDLLVTLPTVVKSIAAEDLIVLDPPRSGVHPEVLARISRSQCRKVIYLSCNAARLARDLRILKEHRFVPTEIQPYDFFPQTPTIETLAILQR